MDFTSQMIEFPGGLAASAGPSRPAGPALGPWARPAAP
jgi:hypothetical protein